MSKKYPYQIGDLIHNKKANILFFIEKTDRMGIYFHMLPDDKRMYIRKSRLKEQLSSEEGKESLVYYPV